MIDLDQWNLGHMRVLGRSLESERGGYGPRLSVSSCSRRRVDGLRGTFRVRAFPSRPLKTEPRLLGTEAFDDRQFC